MWDAKSAKPAAEEAFIPEFIADCELDERCAESAASAAKYQGGQADAALAALKKLYISVGFSCGRQTSGGLCITKAPGWPGGRDGMPNIAARSRRRAAAGSLPLNMKGDMGGGRG